MLNEKSHQHIPQKIHIGGNKPTRASVTATGIQKEQSVREDIRTELIQLLPRLRRFARSLTGTADQADDLVQTGLEKALRNLDCYTPGTRLDA